MPEKTPTLIVLVIDGLNASMLGPYGNTSVETRSFNRLAAESIVFDSAVVNSPSLSDAYRDFWFLAADQERKSQSITQTGGFHQSLLLSDDPAVCVLGEEAQFDRIISVDATPNEQLADDRASTSAAQFFVDAVSTIESVEPGDLCWLHCQGLLGPWDAPYEMRATFADEDDPDPPTFSQPPIANFDAATGDPDELLGYQQAAYAQIELLDDFVGLLLDRIELSSTLRHSALVVTSPRGYGLGEHGTVGKWNQLHSESIHVPLFVRPPSESQFAGWRNRWLTQNQSLAKMMNEIENGNFNSTQLIQKPWPITDSVNREGTLQDDASDTTTAFTDNEAFSSSEHSRCVQTSDWKLIVTREPEQVEKIQLYSKPDDRWEVNDVSSRCPQVVQDLLERLDEYF